VDAVLTTLIGAAPQLGGAGLLLVLLGLLLRRESQDRVDYRTQITHLTERHAEELKRINAAHDEELAELRKEIAGLRTQLSEVNTKLDVERDRRRAAEDSAMGQLGRHRQGDAP
jgi:predicted RNase H-like nuclease (RuvC/YqgF family)